MQVGPGIISSRMFARDDRPVPNIVAIYERPRLKVRRDATHVLGGMFGWNAPEEMARVLRSEDSPTEESAAAIASISNSATADASLSGHSQRCKRPTKRSKRRAIIPLSEMGASILSLSLQERMNRRPEGDEKEDHGSVSTLVKSPVTPLDSVETTPDSTATVKKIKIAAPGDAPTTKKLRLTISTAPPASNTSVTTPLLQLPLSPPDTSSNASKAPTDERYAGPITASTPRTAQLPMPNFELDLSNLAGLTLSTLDSDSDSDSSSESSSESSSDSPDLSSSTSTRSASQEVDPIPPVKAKGKEKSASEPAPNESRNTTPSVAAPSTGNPSTPPRVKRRTHRPGWVGWVQTEESPDHSRLIRLDDVPVILGRRTRSGKEFADPPPIRRKSTAPNDIQGIGQADPAATSQDPKQQSSRKEAQKRGATTKTVGAKANGDHTLEATEDGHNTGTQAPSVPARVKSSPVKAANPSSASRGDTAPTSKRGGTSLTESANPKQPARGTLPPAKNSTGLSLKARPISPTVLKLTRSDTIITPTGARSNDLEGKAVSPVKESPSKLSEPNKTNGLGDLPVRPLPILGSTRKPLIPTVGKVTHRIIKGTAQSHSKDVTTGSVSRPALGTSNSSTLNGVKSAPVGSNPSPTSPVKKSNVSAIGSSSRNAPTPGTGEKTLATPRNSTEKAQVAKPESTWSNPILPTSNSGGLSRIMANANSSHSLKITSSASKTTKPFPMAAPARTEKSEPDSKVSPFMKFSTLGKRKDSSSPLPSGQSSSSSQSRIKKRKLALSSSDESEGPKFIVNPFDRRAKKMELTRKGVSGEAFQAEMKKWTHVKKAEWRERERQKERQIERSNGNNEVRTAIAEGKPVSEFVRHRLAGSSTSTRIGDAKLARKKVYNSDWGMDVAKVSVAGGGEKRAQPKTEAVTERRDLGVRDARESTTAGKIKRELDTSRDLAKPRRVVL